ncbi:MAG: hypothetical protein WBP46_03105 [Thiolinea sp.]|jgi:hypothetical protein
MTIEQLDAMYKKSFALALVKRNPAAMVAAATALAKLHGLNAPDRRLVTHSGNVPATLSPDMTVEEMSRVYEDLRRASHH